MANIALRAEVQSANNKHTGFYDGEHDERFKGFSSDAKFLMDCCLTECHCL